MFIVCITVPIENYYQDGIFEKRIYFECADNSPTKEQVINSLEQIHEENMVYSEYTGEIKDTLDCVELVKDWKFVSPCGIVHTNTFVNTKYGSKPFSWEVIDLIRA